MKRINKQLIVHTYELPLYCNGKTVSDNYKDIGNHPKVYLPIQEQKIIVCPYCGIEYILVKEQQI